MILANIPLPDIQIPADVRKSAKHPEIIPFHRNVPFGAGSWIGCCYAWPHVDPCWDGDYFLTLTVFSDKHQIGDAASPEPLMNVPRGTLFVVDPRVRHWLSYEPSWRTTRTAPWIAVQWEVPRAKAKQLARKIVTDLDGVWVETLDNRYKNWAPK